ncbi:sodium/potassium-transporting ATPase subunit gamma-like [Larimichthys crocea]|uniref:sodium/potassium-transporting ATPase subunit gamma-like n=1 Tax=Larimichthys crocea TaxID=215358 RepID=UPI000900AEBC|nr:sodium/potassium-transporting ATPase subunit gamma-like [Larimichthys crocea]
MCPVVVFKTADIGGSPAGACCYHQPNCLYYVPLVLSTEHTHTHRRDIMSSAGANVDLDADFVYDYHTLRVGGLVFAGVIVFLSIILLAGNKLANCGKTPKPRAAEED